MLRQLRHFFRILLSDCIPIHKELNNDNEYLVEEDDLVKDNVSIASVASKNSEGSTISDE